VVRQGVDVQRVVEAFRGAGTRTNIVVLDACRDNPFGGGALRGLAPMDAPPGTFFAYATAPGNVAADGTERSGNGLYTSFLLKELQQPEARIEDVFKRVRLQVRQATQGRQVPWESTSLEEDFVFATGRPVQLPAARERDRVFETERAEWQRIADSKRAEDFYAFLQRFPSGPFSELAQFSLDHLARPAVEVQAPQALQQVNVLPAGVARYRVGDAWEQERVDHLNGGARRRLAYRVTALRGGQVFINDGQTVTDQMGTLLRSEFSGSNDPGFVLAPAGLFVGKRWRAEFWSSTPSQAVARNYFDARVEAVDEIELPFGRFRAYRVVHEGLSVRPDERRALRTVGWFDPETMWTLRRATRLSDPDRGWIEVDRTDTTVAMTRGPRT
jgi:hypothetical protein